MELAASQYRQFAEECRELIRSAITADEKQFLQEREASWRTLAEEADRTRASTKRKLVQRS